MKSVSVYKLDPNAPARAGAKVFEVMADMNRRSKTGFNVIGLNQFRDHRNQLTEFVVAYDEATHREFHQRMEACGASSAYSYSYVPQPHYRHYLEVHANGKLTMHWHPKDSFVEVEDVNKHALLLPAGGESTINPSKVFFVGPNRQVRKAHARYKALVAFLKHYPRGFTTKELHHCVEPFGMGGEVCGGAMYIITRMGVVLRVTTNGMDWVILRPEVGNEERRRRAAHGYMHHAIGVSRSWDGAVRHTVRPNYDDKLSKFNTKILVASATQEAYFNL